jgi:hypothetical protein
MKLSYYGSAISPNITETPEGFLICKNVPVARTGDMEYMRQELQLDGAPEKTVIVHRDESEVFHPAAIASFEGKPVTDGHPSQNVEPDNYANYAKGHAQNVRRGTGEDGDKLVADLFINDPILTSEIKNNVRREISCGYYFACVPNEDGSFSQVQIRGNHVAVVDKGRAGESVCIKDGVPTPENQYRKEKIHMKKKKRANDKVPSFLRLLVRSARDAKDADELEEVIDDAAETLEKIVEDEETEPPEESAVAEIKDDAGLSPEILAAIKLAVKEAVADCGIKPTEDGGEEGNVANAAKTVSDEGDDLIAALIEKLEGDDDENKSIAEQEETLTVSPDTMDSDNSVLSAEATETTANDSAVNFLKAIQPAIAKIKNPADRKRVSDAALKSVIGNLGGDSMAGIMKAAAGAARKKAMDSMASKTIDVAAQQAAYDKRNPHLNKREGK